MFNWSRIDKSNIFIDIAFTYQRKNALKEMFFIEQKALKDRYRRAGFVNIDGGCKYAYGMPVFKTLSSHSGKDASIYVSHAQTYYPNVAETKHSLVLNSHHGKSVEQNNQTFQNALQHLRSLFEKEYPESSNSIRDEVRVRWSDAHRAILKFGVTFRLISPHTMIYVIPSQLFAALQLRLLEKIEWLACEAKSFNVTTIGRNLLHEHISMELRFMIGCPTDKKVYSLAAALKLDETNAFRISKAISFVDRRVNLDVNSEKSFKSLLSVLYYQNDASRNPNALDILKSNFRFYQRGTHLDCDRMFELFLRLYFETIPQSSLKDTSGYIEDPNFSMEFLISICHSVRVRVNFLSEEDIHFYTMLWFPEEGKEFNQGRNLNIIFESFYNLYGACSNNVRDQLRRRYAQSEVFPCNVTQKENRIQCFQSRQIKNTNVVGVSTLVPSSIMVYKPHGSSSPIGGLGLGLGVTPTITVPRININQLIPSQFNYWAHIYMAELEYLKKPLQTYLSFSIENTEFGSLSDASPPYVKWIVLTTFVLADLQIRIQPDGTRPGCLLYSNRCPRSKQRTYRIALMCLFLVFFKEIPVPLDATDTWPRFYHNHQINLRFSMCIDVRYCDFLCKNDQERMNNKYLTASSENVSIIRNYISNVWGFPNEILTWQI